MSFFDNKRIPNVRIDLKSVHAHQCSKPGCTAGRGIQRHHMGSERMWVRHFADRFRTKRYKEFKARYEAFLVKDTIPLCQDHHEEIHELYEAEIQQYLKDYPECLRKYKTWTWEEAEALMDRLRTVCQNWLVVPSPGSRGRRFVRGTPAARRKDAVKRFGPRQVPPKKSH